ncbi:MAG TPA: hypothetical protein VHC49_08675 [Mycobacteriales bacterium]|nr:hypothetical protein [Mycobacteriales bacterium]
MAVADGLRLQRLLGTSSRDRADVLADVVRWMRTGRLGSAG